MDDLLRLLAVLALVGANAFFVIGEYAVVTARRGPLAAEAAAGSRRAAAALRLMDDPVRVISSVQVGITALGILTGALGEPLVREVVGDGLPGWAGFTIAFATVTFLSVVLGELVPKALTLDRAERLAALVARPIDLQARALRPVVWLLERSAALVLRPFGVGEVVAGEGVRSPEELRALVDEAEQGGVIPRDQEELLHNVLDFAERDVRDALTPARDVAWLHDELTIQDALGVVVERPHTRYPVGRGSLDRVTGVVHLRDLVAAARTGSPATVGELARPAYVVPEVKALRPLLRELRDARQQLAIVADEYGGVAGIVTLEDVVEQLLGEIRDEHDHDAPGVQDLPDGAVRAPGSTSLRALGRHLGVTFEREGPRTIGGLAFDALGRPAQPGDRVRVGPIDLAVEEVDGPRVVTVRLEPQQH